MRLLAIQLAVLVALGTELWQTNPTWAAPPVVTQPPAKVRDPETPAPQPPQPPQTQPPQTPTTTPPSQPDPTPPPSPQPPATNPAPGDGLVNTQPGFLAGVAIDPPGGKYQEGQKLVVRFQAEKEAHVYLLYYQADGQCLLLFPNQAHADSRVAAKSPVTIPATGENFRFRVRSPFGEEAMQVLASAKPIDELEQLAKQASRAVPVSAEAQASLKKRIQAEPQQYAEHRVRLHTFEAEKLPPARPAARIALCLGCNSYANQAPDKGDAEFGRSAELFAKMFREKAGCDPAKTWVLTGEKATRSNFIEAITKTLVENSQPGDLVFISYTGHGGRVKNFDGSEQDGYDEFITFYDTVEDENKDWEQEMRLKGLTDDALARIVSELQGRQVVLFLDTCHGGGLVDAKGLNSLFAEEARRVGEVAGMNIVAITGCLPDESVTFKRDDAMATFMPMLFWEGVQTLPAPVRLKDAFEYYRKTLGPMTLKLFPKYFAPGEFLYGQEPQYVDNALLPILLVPGTAPAGTGPGN